jgi:hypothetical protein
MDYWQNRFLKQAKDTWKRNKIHKKLVGVISQKEQTLYLLQQHTHEI